MAVIVFILFLVVLYLWYLYDKTLKIANKNYEAVNQNSLMLEFYAHLLHILMEQKKKATEEDYRKIVGTLWDIDGWALDYRVFDEKWKKICEALDIKPQFDNKDENNISGKNIEIIAARLYRGRHVFQQYAEQAERSKKISDEIDKDPKYNY